MSDTEKPSWEWRALAAAREREMEEELAEGRQRLQDRQMVNEWLARRLDALKEQLAAVTQERDALLVDRRKMIEEYEAWCLEDV